MFLPEVLFNIVCDEITRGELNTWRQKLLLFIGVPAKISKVEGRILVLSFSSPRKNCKMKVNQDAPIKLDQFTNSETFQQLQETNISQLFATTPDTQKSEFFDYVKQFNTQNITVNWFRNLAKIVTAVATGITAYLQEENRRLAQENRRRPFATAT